MTYLTRRDRLTALAALGVDGDALKCLLRETAAERHASRVAYARWAAEQHALTVMAVEPHETDAELHAGMILWADVIGVGGRDGVEGAATERHPAFDMRAGAVVGYGPVTAPRARCGKGRKQASDGGAWSAAILGAARQLGGAFRVNAHGDGRASLAYAIDTVSGGRVEPYLRRECSVCDPLVPAAWVYSILREGLRRAAGLRRWHPDVPFVAPPESLAEWAKLVNEAAEPPMPATY